MKNKKIMLIFVLICIIVFVIFNYIFLNLGNNKIRNKDEIVEYISEISNNYEAFLEINIFSNKNENNYKMYQLVDNKNSKLVVIEPQIIENLTIELNNKTLKVSNSNLKMEKIYNDYEAVINNSLFLNTFINDFLNNEGKIIENDNEIIMEVSLENSFNTYINFKELHIDKGNNLPKELIIKDNTKSTKICIKYNDIRIK